jgi:hypothetical protein
MPLETNHQILNKTVSSAFFPITEKSLKHNFASLSHARKWNYNTLYSKSTMNKFNKRNLIMKKSLPVSNERYENLSTHEDKFE